LEKTFNQEGLYYANLKAAAGWNSINLGEINSSYKFFIHDENSFQAMRQAQLHKINTQAAGKPKLLSKRENTKTESLPFYWGLLISLLGFGGLWFHERIYA